MSNKDLPLFDRRPKRKLAAILAADVVGFSKMAYELLRNTKVKHTLKDAQRARRVCRERLQMRIDSKLSRSAMN